MTEQRHLRQHHQADQEEVAQMLTKYNFLALPVVDTENRHGGYRHLR